MLKNQTTLPLHAGLRANHYAPRKPGAVLTEIVARRCSRADAAGAGRLSSKRSLPGRGKSGQKSDPMEERGKTRLKITGAHPGGLEPDDPAIFRASSFLCTCTHACPFSDPSIFARLKQGEKRTASADAVRVLLEFPWRNTSLPLCVQHTPYKHYQRREPLLIDGLGMYGIFSTIDFARRDGRLTYVEPN